MSICGLVFPTTWQLVTNKIVVKRGKFSSRFISVPCLVLLDSSKQWYLLLIRQWQIKLYSSGWREQVYMLASRARTLPTITNTDAVLWYCSAGVRMPEMSDNHCKICLELQQIQFLPSLLRWAAIYPT